MKKKSIFGTLIPTLAVGALGLVTTPSGQQLTNQAMQGNNGTQITQQAPQKYVNNTQQRSVTPRSASQTV